MGIPENAVIKEEQILDYIPQRPPIVMVDEFLGIKDLVSYSAITIKKDNIFLEKGYFNESGIIEHIAQSCALRVGYTCRQNNLPVPIGYIGAIKKMKILQLPALGDRITTSIKIEQEIFNITLISAEVKLQNNLIASCEMKIYLETS